MDQIIIVDFGSQYNQLIARRVRELGVYSEVVSHDTPLEYYLKDEVKGIILSGGPNSVYDDFAPTIPEEVFDQKPILGICYGMQLTQKIFGGTVSPSDSREYGRSTLKVTKSAPLFNGVYDSSIVWMSHGDHVSKPAPGFEIIGETDSSIAALKHESLPIYNLQFHPEVTHSEYGHIIIENFVLEIAKASKDWTMENFIEEETKRIKEVVGDKEVILGLSGGVDSSVAAVLIHQAIKDQLTCIYVDTGLMRKNETEQVETIFRKHYNMNLKIVHAEELFFSRLKGETDPEKKRKIIGNTFVEVFEDQKREMQDAHFLAQGTIYPDVIESLSIKGPSHTIKSHHNVGGLPEEFSFELLEPIRELFKDEVRRVGLALGLPEEMIMRHPFPGPGLGIRVIEEVTEEKVKILQEADDIFIKKLRAAGLYEQTSQAFVTLLPTKTVGVMGDQRTYEHVAAIRSVNTTDFMTAVFTKFDFDFLDEVATEIINKVKGINRVVYDITSKPPGTIEWE